MIPEDDRSDLSRVREMPEIDDEWLHRYRLGRIRSALRRAVASMTTSETSCRASSRPRRLMPSRSLATPRRRPSGWRWTSRRSLQTSMPTYTACALRASRFGLDLALHSGLAQNKREGPADQAHPRFLSKGSTVPPVRARASGRSPWPGANHPQFAPPRTCMGSRARPSLGEAGAPRQSSSIRPAPAPRAREVPLEGT